MGDDERDMVKNRESLSYVWPLSDHGFTDFRHSGFRELSTCIPVAGGINMRRIRSELSSDCFSF